MKHQKTQEDILETYLAKLKESGIRVTPKRKAVLEYMINSRTHPTAEDIYNDLIEDYPSMSLATVYNNLNLFVELGFIKELQFDGLVSRYDFYGDEHDHMYCTTCDTVYDCELEHDEALKGELSRQLGYQLGEFRLEIYTKCKNCIEQED